MYHIVKSKDQFMVVLVGRNGEALSTSERFTTKAKAFKNVSAQLQCTNNVEYFAQDDTTEPAKRYKVSSMGSKEKIRLNPSLRYTPGPNPKKKKV